MKRLITALLFLPAAAFSMEPYRPDLGLGPKPPVWPLPAPDTRVPVGLLPKTVPWTTAGAGNMPLFSRQICQGETFIRCENVAHGTTGAIDHGFRMYRKDNGAYLGTMNRNVAEEVQQDYAKAMDTAEEHRPESAWIARKEAEIAQLEYVAAACTSGGVFCTGMAARLQKFKEIFSAICSAWTGVCVTTIKEMQAEIREKIKYVEEQCEKGDQDCFDAVTNGGEKQARAQRALEKSVDGGSRPPHTPIRPGSGRPPFLPASSPDWYDGSCEHCKTYEGKDAEEY